MASVSGSSVMKRCLNLKRLRPTFAPQLSSSSVQVETCGYFWVMSYRKDMYVDDSWCSVKSGYVDVVPHCRPQQPPKVWSVLAAPTSLKSVTWPGPRWQMESLQLLWAPFQVWVQEVDMNQTKKEIYTGGFVICMVSASLRTRSLWLWLLHGAFYAHMISS